MFQGVSNMPISIYFLLLDEICGVLLEHVHTIVSDKECSIPLMNLFPQVH